MQCNAYSRAVCELLIILRPVKYLKVLLGFVEQCRLIRVAWYKSKKADDEFDLDKFSNLVCKAHFNLTEERDT